MRTRASKPTTRFVDSAVVAAVMAFFAALPASATRNYIAIPLGTLGGETKGLSINASGQVAGESYLGTGVHHAFLYSGGAMQDLGTLRRSI